MYRQCDLEDRCITLHDCEAEAMCFDKGVLSFRFPNGFWVTPQHPQNTGENTVRTDASQVDFELLDEEPDNICIYIFQKNRKGTVIREEWKPEDFINAVNCGEFRVEFITQYKSFQSVLYQCWVWLDKKPYHMECEITLQTEKVAYRWNYLRYDSVW